MRHLRHHGLGDRVTRPNSARKAMAARVEIATARRWRETQCPELPGLNKDREPGGGALAALRIQVRGVQGELYCAAVLADPPT